MSTALIIRERNPDDNFVLHGVPPIYNERKSFYPTNSDLTTTTRNLSQRDHRSALYRDVSHVDHSLPHSLRSTVHSLRLVSDDIQKNLEEESSVRRNYLQSLRGQLTFKDEADMDNTAAKQPFSANNNTRRWLTDSEWNTSSGHHVAYEDGVRRTTLLNKSPSTTLTLREELLERPAVDNEREADRLRRTINLDMNLAQVPVTRFTRKDLMASEFFPITMSGSLSGSEDGTLRSFRRSRSGTRSPDRMCQSARSRARTPDRVSSSLSPLTDNYRSMKRLEKLYLVTAEAPTLASAPHAIVSPYAQEIAQLRLQRLKLEEAHLKELNRLTTLERVRGPKPKWYELKDTQFHFEAGKNNELLRTQDRWNAKMKSRVYELSQSQPDLSTLRMRSASFS